MMVAMRIDLFMDPAEFRKQMDGYVRQVRQLKPLPRACARNKPAGLTQPLPGPSGLGCRTNETESPAGATQKRTQHSIKHITLVIFNLMFLQQPKILVFKCVTAVVFHLFLNVAANSIFH